MINIYGKLGVDRRWDAVVKAERLGFSTDFPPCHLAPRTSSVTRIDSAVPAVRRVRCSVQRSTPYSRHWVVSFVTCSLEWQHEDCAASESYRV